METQGWARAHVCFVKITKKVMNELIAREGYKELDGLMLHKNGAFQWQFATMMRRIT